MQIEWQGFYLDGKTASRQKATVYLMKTGLQVRTESGETLWWPHDQIRQTQGFHAGEEIRLEKGTDLPEAILIQDTAFLTNLHRIAPGVSNRFHNPSHRRFRVQITILAAAGAVVVAAALYLWGIPAMASFVAPHVPVAWEERLGHATVESLAPQNSRCAASDHLKVIESIMAKLTAPLANSPYTYRVIVLNRRGINAFAAPGGYIVILRSLIENTKSAEELAGVLAHEIQHIEKRHTTRALLQQASIGLLIAAITGDASGTMIYGLESARALGTLRYTRQSEEEADREGVRLLIKAGINPKGMIRFFEMIKEKEGDLPESMKYLSTHPMTKDRIETLKSLAAASPRPAKKLLANYDWSRMETICEDLKDKKGPPSPK